MQTPKPSRKSSEVPQKISPRSVSSEAPPKVSSRVVRQLKTTGLELDSASSSNQPSRTPKNTSPKVAERRSPRSPVTELQKKRPGRVAELESQIAQLQEDLKTVKDQLISSESWKKEAQQDAEESRKKLLVMSSKLEESRQLLAQSSYKEAPVTCITEIQNQSEEDQAWKSKLEAIQRQHSIDSAALATAMNEIEQLKFQLEMVAESEATQTKEVELAYAELHSLKENLAETISHVEDMKNQLKDCKQSEAKAQALVGETLLQLQSAKKTIESLKSDGNKSVEEYDAIALELDQSKARVDLLEGLVNKFKDDSVNFGEIENKGEHGKSIEAELVSLKSEVERLRSALEIAEMRYNEELIRSTVQSESTHELVEQIKSSSSVKVAELEAEIQKSKADIEELKANLMDKETELQGICEENDDLNTRLKNTLSGQREIELEKERKKLKDDFNNLKAVLMDKETEVQNILEENEMLKSEIKKKESRVEDEVVGDLEAARASEREALMKLGYMMEETDKSNRKVVRVTEQLEATQAANLEMEAELRRLKVQSDQWRKAAEAAAAMLSTGNGKFGERTGSLDSNYSPKTGKISSPYSEDMDEDLLKKKNGNVLKRIGVLWKKPQNKAP